MDFKIKNRDGQLVEPSFSASGVLDFLYNNAFGRGFLKILVLPFLSKVAGAYMNTRLSKIHIKKLAKKTRTDYSQLEKTDFRSFNDFFTRRIKPEYRPIDTKRTAFISPADSKLTVYNISENNSFFIKGSHYSLSDLLGGDITLANEFVNGVCLIFRLAVDDYHRYCYIDDCSKKKSIFVKGVLHTVNPIALYRYNIYKQNSRVYTLLETENFGRVVHVEIGAMMVGKIKNFHDVGTYKKGEEKGMFEFGGSTIVVLTKKGVLTVDEDILENSAQNIETIVKMGERIGNKSSINRP